MNFGRTIFFLNITFFVLVSSSIFAYDKKDIDVVAHGKSINIAEESTWDNLGLSVLNEANVLEFDIRLTKEKEGNLSSRNCDYVVYHDPTFHGLSNGSYHTSESQINEIKKGATKGPKDPRLINTNLYDRTYDHSRERILGDMDGDKSKQNIYVYDSPSDTYQKPIFLDQMFDAITTGDDSFTIPSHSFSKSFKNYRVPESTIDLKGQKVQYYLDLKEVNQFGRTIEGLGGWDTPMVEMSPLKQADHVKLSLECLSKNIDKNCKSNANCNNSFTAIRHPCVEFMTETINSNLKTMISTDLVTRHSSTDDFIKEIEQFGSNDACKKCQKYFSDNGVPTIGTIQAKAGKLCGNMGIARKKNGVCQSFQLVEVKYIHHMQDQKLVEAANKNCWKLFFNSIWQTDAHQFIDLDAIKNDKLKMDYVKSLSGVAPSKELVPNEFKDFNYDDLSGKLYSEKWSAYQDYLKSKSVADKEGKLKLAIFGKDPAPGQKRGLAESDLPKKKTKDLLEQIYKSTKKLSAAPMIQTNEVGQMVKAKKGIEDSGISHTAGLSFLKDTFYIKESQKILAGGKLRVEYQKERLSDCSDCLKPVDNLKNIKLHYKIKTKSGRPIFAHTNISEDGKEILLIPSDACEIEIWFESDYKVLDKSKNLLKGVEKVWDSNFGLNYKYPIYNKNGQNNCS